LRIWGNASEAGQWALNCCGRVMEDRDPSAGLRMTHGWELCTGIS